nr:MAG TPA: Pnkp1/Rnl/Hen1 repair, kinase, phosphatase, methyltransferase [Caudoviricetes sp.]
MTSRWRYFLPQQNIQRYCTPVWRVNAPTAFEV